MIHRNACNALEAESTQEWMIQRNCSEDEHAVQSNHCTQLRTTNESFARPLV